MNVEITEVDIEILCDLLSDFHDGTNVGHYGNRPDVCTHPTCREASRVINSLDWR